MAHKPNPIRWPLRTTILALIGKGTTIAYTQIGLLLGLGLWCPKTIGLFLGLGLLPAGVQSKSGSSLVGLGLPGPKQIGLAFGLGLWGPRPDRTRKSAPLKSDSGLDSDFVRFLASAARPVGAAAF
jgi:hypothetical protein